MSSEDNVITEQPITAETAETTEFSLFGKSKAERSDASLEMIRKYESLIVKQELDVMGSICDKCCCCDKMNKYRVKDTDGKTVLKAVEGLYYIFSGIQRIIIFFFFFTAEEESCCAVNCCKRGRHFEMKLTDSRGNQVIRLKMKNQCCGRCLCFCRYKVMNTFI